ncbi:hypothetical protein Hanom_Chr05g00392841 [Helianthus anomalus]
MKPPSSSVSSALLPPSSSPIWGLHMGLLRVVHETLKIWGQVLDSNLLVECCVCRHVNGFLNGKGVKPKTC